MSWRVKVVAGWWGVESAKGILIRQGFSREPRREGRNRQQGQRGWPRRCDDLDVFEALLAGEHGDEDGADRVDLDHVA